MAEAAKRAIAQGKRGGYYLVGSDRMVGGKLKRVYVNPDKYLASSGGQAPEAPKIEAPEPAVTAKPEPQGGKTQEPEKAASGKIAEPAIDEKTGFRIAGNKPKERDSRLPPVGTEMTTKGKGTLKVTVKEDDRGVFTVYGEDGKPGATGYTVTAALSSFFGKPVSGISYLGLQKKRPPKEPKADGDTTDTEKKPATPKDGDTQEPDGTKAPKKPREKKPKDPGETSDTPKPKRPKKPRGESGELYRQEFPLMKMRQKIKNWARFDVQQALGHDARNIPTVKGSIGNKQYIIKQDKKGRMWAKEKGAKNKPFIVTKTWLKSNGRVPTDKGAKPARATKEPVTVMTTRKLKAPETIKKALDLLQYTDADRSATLDIHSDGVVIRNCIGRISGFVPFDEPLTGMNDDLMKSLPDGIDATMRFELSAVERVSTDNDEWQQDGLGFIRSTPIHAIQSEDCAVKAFCYDRSRMDFVGFATVQEMCKALGVDN